MTTNKALILNLLELTKIVREGTVDLSDGESVEGDLSLDTLVDALECLDADEIEVIAGATGGWIDGTRIHRPALTELGTNESIFPTDFSLAKEVSCTAKAHEKRSLRDMLAAHLVAMHRTGWRVASARRRSNQTCLGPQFDDQSYDEFVGIKSSTGMHFMRKCDLTQRVFPEEHISFSLMGAIRRKQLHKEAE